jgi:hypothetical protein
MASATVASPSDIGDRLSFHTSPTRDGRAYQAQLRSGIVDEAERDIGEVDLMDAVPLLDPDPFSFKRCPSAERHPDGPSVSA